MNEELIFINKLYNEEGKKIYKYVFKTSTSSFVYCDMHSPSKEDWLELIDAVLNNKEETIAAGGNSYSFIKVKDGYVIFGCDISGMGGDSRHTTKIQRINCINAFVELKKVISCASVETS